MLTPAANGSPTKMTPGPGAGTVAAVQVGGRPEILNSAPSIPSGVPVPFAATKICVLPPEGSVALQSWQSLEPKIPMETPSVLDPLSNPRATLIAVMSFGSSTPLAGETPGDGYSRGSEASCPLPPFRLSVPEKSRGSCSPLPASRRAAHRQRPLRQLVAATKARDMHTTDCRTPRFPERATLSLSAALLLANHPHPRFPRSCPCR